MEAHIRRMVRSTIAIGLVLALGGCAARGQTAAPATVAKEPTRTTPVAETLAVVPSAPDDAPATATPVGTAAEAVKLEETPTPSPVASASPAAPAAPAATVAVSIADELPYLAVHAQDEDAVESRARKHTGGTTSARSKRRGKKRPYHPAPREIVDITSAAAGASQADVQRLARAKGYNPFRSCFEEGLRRDQKLGGKVTVDFTLGANGEVVGAKKTAATLGDDSVVQCVVREAGRLELARPESGTPAITMVVTLSPGDDPIPVPRAAPHADRLREALRSRWSGVEVCYKDGLARRADLGGRLEVKLRVSPHGDVLEASEGATRFGDAAVTKCVVDVMKVAKLPKLGTKHETSFVYALHVESAPTAATPSEDVANNP
jgi:outer membrane biosynthesis protein TonB